MPEIPKARKRGQASHEQRDCAYCGRKTNVKGVASHERACKRKKEDFEKTLRFLANQRQEIRDKDLEDALAQTRRALEDMNLNDNPIVDGVNDIDNGNEVPINVEYDVNPTRPAPSDSNQQEAPNSIPAPINLRTGELIKDAIKIVYHPNSKQVEEIKSLLDYRCQTKITPPVEEEPWKSFETRGDYEFAEISLAADVQFTIRNNTELQDKWKKALSKLTDFEQKDFDVEYKGETRTFKVYYRPIWDWILDLLRDPRTVSQFIWDARKVYKYQTATQSYVRIFDEPWTADRFWEVQSSFRDEQTKPFSIIFYADKNKLSSFGTQKGYPVVVRCANLPVSMRNSDGIGGGIIIGWLPIVPETAQDSGKVTFANFKTKVWHRAVDVILSSMREASKVGHWVDCSDGITRLICPHISMISADHEEQGVIALNRGPKGKKACGVCNHPTRKLSNLLVTHTPRTAKDSRAYYRLTKSFSTFKSKDFILKLHGLRPNVFWTIGHTDVHWALSWDRLHTYHSGLFAAHIWPVFKSYFEDLGRGIESRVDERLRQFPRWRNLYHFESALKVTFNDGSKHEDLSKQLIYVIHDIFERKEGSAGYLFARLFQKYLELDVLMSFELHTKDTIATAEAELRQFGKLLLDYATLTKDTSDKNWDFPKAHKHKHACEDIRAKGVTRNFNTKPNEKSHGPLRDIYHEQTNFRDVAPQILKVSHNNLISTYIRGQLDILDGKPAEEEELEDNSPRASRRFCLQTKDLL